MIRDPQGLNLVRRCVGGDDAARREFRDSYWPLIGRFGGDEAALDEDLRNFDLHLFEEDRLFLRLRSFAGRTRLASYLQYEILPDMFRTFRSAQRRRRVQAESVEDLPPSARERALATEGPGTPGEQDPIGAWMVANLSREERILWKLLYPTDYDLEEAEIAHLADTTRRSTDEVRRLAGAALESASSRREERDAKCDLAASAAEFLREYERQLTTLRLDAARYEEGSERGRRVRAEISEYERKSAWRRRQRDRALSEAEHTVVTLSYRQIALILGQPIGTVGSSIARLRAKIASLIGPRLEAPR